MSENLYDLFASRFPADPNAPFLIGPRSVMTYGALDDLTGRMSAALCSAGAKPGDRIAAQIEKSAEGVALYLAAVRAGLVYLPLNTAYRDDEVAYFLRDSEPSIVVADPARLTSVSAASSAAAPAVLTMDASGNGSLSDLARTFNPDPGVFQAGRNDMAAILYSSGTTGKPKGVMLTHGNLASNALTLHKLWQFEPGDVLIHALPIFHVHGLFVALNTSLLNGSAVLFHEKFDADAILADMPRATLFMGVPTFYVRLLAAAALTRESCAHMRLFISGSAPLLPETFDRFAERTGHQILERYGMTEAGMITSARPDLPRRAGHVGWPLPGVSVRVAPESGGIEIKGPNVFAGYWRQPDKTAEDFTADGYFKTGDLGAVGGDGAISIIGRAKDMFISGGFNVYPKEIETCIDAIPGVDESAVIGMPHPDFGEAGLAVVVMKAGATTLDEDMAQTALKRQLANYKIPKLFIVAESLPRNTMGKVQKAQMRTSYAAAWRRRVVGE
jgi:malonyl-CoA/methylmalonyl-CoA synthetase